MVNCWSWAALALADLLWPVRCLLCGAGADEVPWAESGSRVPGLRGWDRSPLCLACATGLGDRPRLRRVPQTTGADLLVAAGCAENAELVSVVGALKYHGVRGAAWPLAKIAAPAVDLLGALPRDGTVLSPVPLHPTRRRERGFNQAELLARLLAGRCGLACHAGAVRRRRATPQQAKLVADGTRRQQNMRDAFAAAPPSPGGPAAVILVDDLATSGQTLSAASGALDAAGWRVIGAVVVAAAAGCGSSAGAGNGA